MRSCTGLLMMAALGTGCTTPSHERVFVDTFRLAQGPELPPEQDPAPPQNESEYRLDYEQVFDTGWILRDPEEDWGAHLWPAIGVGITTFDLSNISLDALTTIAIVPTVEAIVPLDDDRRWNLLPFGGLGFAFQLGDNDLIGDQKQIGLATGGVQLMHWLPFAERNTALFWGRVRYDAALTSRDGILGDWGSFDLIAELRHAFGNPADEESHFEAGIYAQGISYWDTIELEIDGVTPTSIDNQLEFGISLGSTRRVDVLGIAIPRVFLGFRFEEDLHTFYIRLGRL